MSRFVVDYKLIRKRMVDLDIRSITELANTSRVSKPTIYEYLNGKSPLSAPYCRLCSVLNISPLDALVEVEESENDEEH